MAKQDIPHAELQDNLWYLVDTGTRQCICAQSDRPVNTYPGWNREWFTGEGIKARSMGVWKTPQE